MQIGVYISIAFYEMMNQGPLETTQMEQDQNSPSSSEVKIHKDLISNYILLEQDAELSAEDLLFIFGGDTHALKDILRLGIEPTKSSQPNVCMEETI